MGSPRGAPSGRVVVPRRLVLAPARQRRLLVVQRGPEAVQRLPVAGSPAGRLSAGTGPVELGPTPGPAVGPARGGAAGRAADPGRGRDGAGGGPQLERQCESECEPQRGPE